MINKQISRYVKVCLLCGGTNIKMPNLGLDVRMTIRDKCLDCDYIGNFPEIDVKNAEEFKKKLKKTDK